MAINFLLKRSNTASKRPTAAQLDIGELSLNYEQNTCGVYFEDSNGDVRKVGPVEVSSSAPNSTPAGSSGNSLGELWYDTGSSNLKIWTGASFVSATSSVAAGGSDTQVQFNSTGSLSGSANFTFDGTSASIAGLVITGTSTFRAAATQDGVKIVGRAGGTSDYDVTVTPTTLTADRTLTLPDVTGTVVTTGDTGSVTSTMILDGTIVDGDVNASAAIAGTKIDPDFGSQTVETTGVFSAAGGAEATPSITFTGDLNTGLWSPSADTIAVSTGGNKAVQVDSSGRVGIGRTPGTVLEIEATDSTAYSTSNMPINSVGCITIFNTDTTVLGSYAGLTLKTYGDNSNRTDAGIGLIKTTSFDSNGALVLGVRDNSYGNVIERMRLDSGGNIGMGTSSPESYTFGNLTVARSSGDAGITIAATSTTDRSVLAFADGTSGDAAYRGRLEYDHSDDSMRINTAAARAVFIDSSQQTGFGTDTPGARVHIESSTSADQLRIGTSSSNYYKIGRDTGNGLLVFDGVQSGNNGYIFTGADGERARIDSSGRLLVGTASASGSAKIQTTSGISYSADSGRTTVFTKTLGLADNVLTTFMTVPVPALSNFTGRFSLGMEISYSIQVGRNTSLRGNQSTFGKVYVAITRYWESSTNAPVTAAINTADAALVQAGGSTTPTWTLSQDAGTDQAAKNVYVEVTMNNPYTNSIYTIIYATARIICSSGSISYT